MHFTSMSARLAVLIALIAIGGCASKQQTFNSPQAATDSLVQALRANDTKALHNIFGPEGDQIITSGDPVADRAEVTRFLSAYDEKHQLQRDDAGRSILILGEEDWPFPVPIVESGNKFMFDTEAGKDEILNRRIGRNELSAQQVCLAIVDAQREYVAQRPMGGDLPLYARKIASDAGKKNGLFWRAEPGQPVSPLGELVALAAEEGYRRSSDSSGDAPQYHGYRYRLLTAQGEHAPGGAMDYEINGNLIGGFAVIAYPAEYGNSGIMTFMTNHDGVLYECDLGDETEKAALGMTRFDPAPPWQVVDNDE